MNWKVIITALIIILCILFFINKTLTSIFFTLAESEAVRIANRAINQSVYEEVELIDRSKLVTYQFKYNNEGEIILVQPNLQYINSFTTSISLSIQEKLESLNKKEVAIPLARILGIDLLAGFGPSMKAKIIPVGFTRPPEVKDSFTTAGINQTRHKIYLEVITQLRLIVPFQSKTIDVTAKVPVNEVTILGRVPRVYIGLDGDKLPGIINQ